LTFWAIVPVKPLRIGKSRLSEVLTVDERAELNRRLLAHTLSTLSEIQEIENVLVISRDQGALALARSHGAHTVQENGEPHLNDALRRATAVAQNYAVRGILVLPADLPFFSAEDIRMMLALADPPPVVVVAPDRHRQGTNALLISPIGLIEYEFGPNSFSRHCQRVLEAGARLEIIDLPSLALDMDLPEDLQIVAETLESYHAELENKPAILEISEQLGW
jgi:2-phospho-L-lactate/phosphoenolpyruvate guanylyltransferase